MIQDLQSVYHSTGICFDVTGGSGVVLLSSLKKSFISDHWFQSFKKLLVAHLAKKQQAEKIRIRYLSERYTQLYNQWVKKLNKRENSSFRKEKDAKFREAFEKVFPELKKQKEDKDKLQRFSVPGNRPPGYARSDAGIEEIVNELHEQEVKEKRMLSLSVSPPMMLDSRQRSLRILDETRLIRSFDFRQKLWTPAETEIFAEKYQQYPKKFGIIASYLDNKTVQDCVLFYYLTKKEANYKQMARRYQAMRKRDKKFRPPQNVQNQEGKLGDASSASEASSSCHGPGFSYMSTILLPTNSIAQALSSNVVSTSLYNSSSAGSQPSPPSASVAEQLKTELPAKKEQDQVKPSRKTPDSVDVQVPEAKKTPSPGLAKGPSPGELKQEASLPDAKQEIPIENAQGVEVDLPTKCPSENSLECKAPPCATEPSPEDKAPTLATQKAPTPCHLPEARSVPPTPSPATTEPGPAGPVPTTTPDKRETISCAFPGMSVEDISDKEDSDSVATLSADEGPAPPSEDKDSPHASVKRPRLLDDGYKEGGDKKKYSEDLVLNWEVKAVPSLSKRHSTEDGHRFFAIPSAEREIRSLPPSELHDRRQEPVPGFHESADGDLIYSLTRKNRSPARIKDLIHAAIEKNLQNSNVRSEGEFNGSASPRGDWPPIGVVEAGLDHSSSPRIQSLLSQNRMQHHYQYQKQHNLPMDPPLEFPPSRHPVMRSPATNDLSQQQQQQQQQQMAIKMMVGHDRLNSYSPSYYQHALLNAHEAVAPPPAHAHHHQAKSVPYEKPSSRGPPTQYMENNRLYELAAIAAERGRLDEKEKRGHKDLPMRDGTYPGTLPLLRLPVDPLMLHKGIPSKSNPVPLHPSIQVPIPPPPPQPTAAAGVNVGSGRGSITKGTSGRSEALHQGPERHANPEWSGPSQRTAQTWALQNHAAVAAAAAAAAAAEYSSSAHVLRQDYLMAHQMSQNQLYHLQQLQHYQGFARQGEKKHRQSPATGGQDALLPLNKNHSNQEPAKKKSRALPENLNKNVYPEQVDYAANHKKVPSMEDIHKQVPVELRAHSRGQQQPGGYYYNNQEAPIHMNDGGRPKSSQQQQQQQQQHGNTAVVDKQSEQPPKMTKKEFQTPPNQMTAANLIEAIIYLQINRNENEDMASKASNPSTLAGPSLLSTLTAREEVSTHDKNSRNHQVNPLHGLSLSSKSYDKAQKFGQMQPQMTEYSVRSSIENRNTIERPSLDKVEESLHALTGKHVKDSNPAKRFAPYDLPMNQTQHPTRQDSLAVNPQQPPSSSVSGRRFITASDRIEAIIAKDIGNQDDLPAQNENVQTLIKEYMRTGDSKLTRYDGGPSEGTLLARFPFTAAVRPYDLDKSYDKSLLPFYAPGMVVPVRMPPGLLDDKPPSSGQGMISPKVWHHHHHQQQHHQGLQQMRPEREVDHRAPSLKQMNVTDLKQNSIPVLQKEQRSEGEVMPLLKRSPSLHPFQNNHQFQHGQKVNAMADFRGMMHLLPELPPEQPVANSSDRTSAKEVNCSDSSTSNSYGAVNLNSPPMPSHMNWKAKMLRQHKEQKIAENSHGHYRPPSENSSYVGTKSFREEEGHSTERLGREDSRSEAELELKDHGPRSTSTMLSSPPENGHQAAVIASPINKPLLIHENSSEGRVETCNMTNPSSYWSPRSSSSTRKCSSNSSDGLRIDIPADDEDYKHQEDKHCD